MTTRPRPPRVRTRDPEWERGNARLVPAGEQLPEALLTALAGEVVAAPAVSADVAVRRPPAMMWDPLVSPGPDWVRLVAGSRDQLVQDLQKLAGYGQHVEHTPIVETTANGGKRTVWLAYYRVVTSPRYARYMQPKRSTRRTVTIAAAVTVGVLVGLAAAVWLVVALVSALAGWLLVAAALVVAWLFRGRVGCPCLYGGKCAGNHS